MSKIVKCNVDGKEISTKVLLSHSQLTVVNETEFDIYCAVYFRLRGKLVKIFYRLDFPMLIKPYSSISFPVPSLRCIRTSKRTLFFSSEPLNLSEYLRGLVTTRISSHSIKMTYILHIHSEDNILRAHTEFTWGHRETILRHRQRISNKKHQLSDKCKPNIYKEYVAMYNERDIPGNIRTANNYQDIPNSIRNRSAPLIISDNDIHYIPAPLPLGEDEKNAIDARNIVIKNGISKLLNLDKNLLVDKKIPKISICLSGGGNRALVSTLGFLRGWEMSGLLDCVSWVSSLSGSCSALALWYCYGGDLDACLKSLTENLHRGYKDCLTSEARRVWSSMVKEGKAHKRPSHRLMDLYNVILGEQLLCDVLPDGFSYKFSSIKSASKIANGLVPIPIFTSGLKEPHGIEWFEITPFEAGSEYLGAFIDVESFGCGFKNGELYRPGPELTLAKLMSFTTAAMCLTTRSLLLHAFGELLVSVPDAVLEFTDSFEDEEFSDDDDWKLLEDFEEKDILSDDETNTSNDMEMLRRLALENEFNTPTDLDSISSRDILTDSASSSILSNSEVKNETPEYNEDIIEKKKKSKKKKAVKKIYNIVNEYDWTHAYLVSPTAFPNFTYKLTGPLKTKKYLKLIDAGFAFCMPVPPLVRQCRNSDIIIAIEMSAPPNCEHGLSLLDAAKWCRKNNVKFPKIDPERLKVPFANQEQIEIFEDENDPEVPAVVYLVLQKNKDYGTFDPILNQHEGGFCNTFCTKMTSSQVQLLAALASFTAQSITDKIKDLIERKMNQIN